MSMVQNVLGVARDDLPFRQSTIMTAPPILGFVSKYGEASMRLNKKSTTFNNTLCPPFTPAQDVFAHHCPGRTSGPFYLSLR